jgi:hypothetical protein
MSKSVRLLPLAHADITPFQAQASTAPPGVSHKNPKMNDRIRLTFIPFNLIHIICGFFFAAGCHAYGDGCSLAGGARTAPAKNESLRLCPEA